MTKENIVDTYVAICQRGLQDVLSLELQNIGAEIEKIDVSTVHFSADTKGLYTANMLCCSAINILKPIKNFFAKDYDILYYQAKKINWHKLFHIDKKIRIDVKGSSRSLNHSQYVMHRVKDAILDTFRKFNEGKRPSVDKENHDIHIIVYLNENNVTIYLDSSGVPLFKRGYRDIHFEAPMKEDLAGGIILLSEWDKKTDILDPFCGSATILIEAYMIANNIPPNLNREFSFFHWFDFDKSTFELAKKELQSKINQTQVKFIGYEKDKNTFRKAMDIIKKLKLDDKIKIINEDFRQSKENFSNYKIITNPPYGERLSQEDINVLYKDIGDFLKQKCKNSTANILTSNFEGAKHFGLRSSKRIELYNGALECRLIEFRMY